MRDIKDGTKFDIKASMCTSRPLFSKEGEEIDSDWDDYGCTAAEIEVQELLRQYPQAAPGASIICGSAAVVYSE